MTQQNVVTRNFLYAWIYFHYISNVIIYIFSNTCIVLKNRTVDLLEFFFNKIHKSDYYSD